MDKTIVLHDRYGNEPMVIRTSAILAVQKRFDRTEDMAKEYTDVFIRTTVFNVSETIGEVIKKIKKAEGEET